MNTLNLRCHIGPSHTPSRPEVALGIACDAAITEDSGLSSITVLLTTLRSHLNNPPPAPNDPLEIYMMAWRAAQQFVPKALLDEMGGEEGFLLETAEVSSPVLKMLADSRLPPHNLETACFFIARAVVWKRFPCFADVHEAGLEKEARGMDIRRQREGSLRNIFQFQTGHDDAPKFGYIPSSTELAYAFVGIGRSLSLYEPEPLTPEPGWFERTCVALKDLIYPSMEIPVEAPRRAHPTMDT